MAEDEELVLPSTAEWNLVLPSVSRRFPLGWSQYVSLLTIDSPDERRFYEIEAAANQWSVRELERQIASSPYQRLALSWDKEEIRRLPAPTVRPIPAQGIALGHRGKASQAPKGRPKTACRDIAPAREFLFPSSLNLHPSHDPYRLQTDRGRRDPGGVGNAPMF